MEYTKTAHEISKAVRKHWVWRRPIKTHMITANTRKELEQKKIKKIKKILNNKYPSYKKYLESWINGCNT